MLKGLGGEILSHWKVDKKGLQAPIFLQKWYQSVLRLRNPLYAFEEFLENRLNASNAGFVGYCLGQLSGLLLCIGLFLLLRKIGMI